MIFEETQPISTYLFSFATGRFTVETAERNGRTLRMFHRETDAKKVARNRDTIFDLQARALAWLEDYTAIPYAFGKFDFVLIPSFSSAGWNTPAPFLQRQQPAARRIRHADATAGPRQPHRA
jgi:aminopeptidase N